MLDLLTGKTVLVTGATGFIGRHLLRRLVDLGTCRLVMMARSPLPAVTERARPEAAHEVTVVTCSLHEATQRIWRNAGVERLDYVFHLGAFTPKTPAEANSVGPICRDNIEGTRALLESLPSTPERVIFASTLDVYAPAAEGEAIQERSSVGPAGLYGASKLFCEQLVRVMARERGCEAVILRYGHIFGPGEEAYGKLIPQMIRTLRAGQAPTLYGDGSAERDFLYVGDAVEATLRAAVVEIPDDLPINIVRGSSRPIRAIAEILVSLSGGKSAIQYLRDRPAGSSLRFDSSRMRAVLGEWPLVSLEEGLAREVSGA